MRELWEIVGALMGVLWVISVVFVFSLFDVYNLI